MRTDCPTHNVLVPIFDGDVTDAAVKRARAELGDPETRLVLLHVVPTPAPPPHAVSEADDGPPPRWHRLAANVPRNRVLVDAVLDEPADAILANADRFGCDRIVVDAPGAAPRSTAGRAVARLLRTSPERVLLATP